MSDLACELVIEENISGSQVSVNEAFLGKVAHPISNVFGELDKQLRHHIRQISIAHSI